MSKNQVLEASYKPSNNFFESDLIFKNYIKKNISLTAFKQHSSTLSLIGKKAAGEMNKLSLLADKHGPQLVKRNQWGEDINEIEFHPAYDELLKIAVESKMFNIKWEPENQKKFKQEIHKLGFSSGYLYAMSESGQYCPLCMTDGVARLIDKFCTEKDNKRLLPKIYTQDNRQLFTGAMFLTEKAGGSDVGANLVRAEKQQGTTYKLYGEKWFCSNANADIIFVLARTNPEVKGTKGLSIFLVEKILKDGSKNNINIVRLKDKLGVRSMASAECLLDGTIGTLIGKEYEGFYIMAEMINLSRIYNSIAALSASRRALIEAYQFLCNRKTFGKIAINHALVRSKLEELGSLHVANFYFVWRAIEALDKADNGDNDEAQLLRVLTPMVKKWSAETAVYIIRESMELMGGMGYIEDTVMPKLMRDVMVLPIWEGAGNIMILDMIRASSKSNGLELIFKEITQHLNNVEAKNYAEQLKILGKQIFTSKNQETIEINAKQFFDKLTTLFQLSLIERNTDSESSSWTKTSYNFLLKNKLNTPGLSLKKPAKTEDIHKLIAWHY